MATAAPPAEPRDSERRERPSGRRENDHPSVFDALADLIGLFARRLRRANRLGGPQIRLTIEIDREDDGRWIAEVLELPGAMAYGPTQHEASQNVVALALRIIADQVEHQEIAAAPQISVQLAPQ